MPLYQCSPATYAGFLSYFNNNSVNGTMGRNEVRSALNRAGCSPTSGEVQQIIDLISVDPNGVSWQCFIDYVSSYTKFRDQEAEYAEAFRMYDVSGSGVLGRQDIKYVMQKIGLKVDIEKLMDEVDTNRDGTIDYDDRKVFTKQTFSNYDTRTCFINYQSGTKCLTFNMFETNRKQLSRPDNVCYFKLHKNYGVASQSFLNM